MPTPAEVFCTTAELEPDLGGYPYPRPDFLYPCRAETRSGFMRLPTATATATANDIPRLYTTADGGYLSQSDMTSTIFGFWIFGFFPCSFRLTNQFLVYLLTFNRSQCGENEYPRIRASSFKARRRDLLFVALIIASLRHYAMFRLLIDKVARNMPVNPLPTFQV